MVLNISDIPDIPDGWKYVISSLVGGGIAIFVTFLNNRYQLRKDSQQWEREKLWDGYQKCISNLNLIESLWMNFDGKRGLSYVLKKEERGQIFSLYSEMYPYLHWIIYNYPNSRLQEIELLKKIIERMTHEDENITILRDKEMLTVGIVEQPIETSTEVEINNVLIHPKLLMKVKKGLIQLMANDSRLLIK